MKNIRARNPLTIRLQTAFAVASLAASLFIAGCQSTDPDVSAQNDGSVFDEKTSGRTLVSDGLARAKAENKKVVLLFGANWCPYCRQLHALFESNPAVSEIVERSFVVVPIDVGTSSRNRNTDLIDRYDSNVFTDGTPSVVIIDASGKRLAPTKDNPWSAKNAIEEKRVIAFLKAAVRQ